MDVVEHIKSGLSPILTVFLYTILDGQTGELVNNESKKELGVFEELKQIQ